MKIYALSMDNPMLNVGDSYSGLEIEVEEWLSLTMPGRWKFAYAYVMGGYYLQFEKDEDFALFLLRWL